MDFTETELFVLKRLLRKELRAGTPSRSLYGICDRVENMLLYLKEV